MTHTTIKDHTQNEHMKMNTSERYSAFSHYFSISPTSLFEWKVPFTKKDTGTSRNTFFET